MEDPTPPATQNRGQQAKNQMELSLAELWAILPSRTIDDHTGGNPTQNMMQRREHP